MREMWNKHQELLLQFWRYVGVGMLNFGLSLGVYWLLMSVLKTHYLMAHFLTWVFGMLFTYAASFLWVFGYGAQLQFRSQFVKFFSVYGGSFLINFFTLRHLVETYGFHPFYTQLCLIPFVMLMNFSGMRFWSFAQRLNPQEK